MGSKVVREHEREYVSRDWGSLKNLFGPQNVGSKYLKISIVEYAPGMTHELHNHPDQEEVIYVLEGEGLARSDEGDKPISTGAFVFIPAYTEHATINISKDKPMKAIIIMGRSRWT